MDLKNPWTSVKKIVFGRKWRRSFELLQVEERVAFGSWPVGSSFRFFGWGWKWWTKHKKVFCSMTHMALRGLISLWMSPKSIWNWAFEHCYSAEGQSCLKVTWRWKSLPMAFKSFSEFNYRKIFRAIPNRLSIFIDLLCIQC